MKVYRGTKKLFGSGGEVYVVHAVETDEAGKEEKRPLTWRGKHSPDGFAWGYGGSGPAELALSILEDHMGDERPLPEFYQAFKREMIEPLDRGADFELSEKQVEEWVQGWLAKNWGSR